MPDEEVFRFATQEVRALGVHLLGRRLYETMSYWETVDQTSLSDLEREFAAVWTTLSKVVLSTTLTSVEDGYRLRVHPVLVGGGLRSSRVLNGARTSASSTAARTSQVSYTSATA